MASLRSLPPELLLSVSRHLTGDPADLAAFARTIRSCHSVVASVLYREYGHFAVGWAAQKGELEPVKLAFRHAATPARRQALHSESVPFDFDRRPDDINPLLLDAVEFLHLSPKESARRSAPALILASHNGHVDIVSYLLDQGAQLTVSKGGICKCPHPRHLNLEDGRPRRYYMLRQLQWLPLHYAICGGHESTASLLLKRGAPLYVGSDQVRRAVSALQSAAKKGLIDTVREIIKTCSSREMIDFRDIRGHSAMHYAALCTDYEAALEIIRDLKRWGLDVNMKGGNPPLTPLLLATQVGIFPAALALLHAGANPCDLSPVHDPWSDGSTPLTNTLLASPSSRVLDSGVSTEEWRQMRVDFVRELLDASENTKGSSIGVELAKLRPLFIAAKKGQIEEIKLLTSNGRVDVDVTDDGGNTALMFAVANGQLEAVKVLLNLGASVNKHNCAGEGPLDSITTPHLPCWYENLQDLATSSMIALLSGQNAA